MFNFFKQPEIVFSCEFPEIQELYPIEPITTVKRNWFKATGAAYKEEVDRVGKYLSVSGTAKCPGIHQIVKHGYVLRAWHDLTIRTTDDDYELSFSIPENMAGFCQKRGWHKEMIGFFPGDASRLAVPVPEGSLKTLIKFSTPWCVKVPKGWSLLIMPVAYGDETRFSSTHGMLPGGEIYQINPILQINFKNGIEKIDAGTPLCQLLFIKDEKINVKFKKFDEEFKMGLGLIDFKTSHTYIRN